MVLFGIIGCFQFFVLPDFVSLSFCSLVVMLAAPSGFNF